MKTTPAASFEVKQEPDELPGRKLLVITVSSFVAMTVALVVSWALLDRWGAPARGGAHPAPSTIGGLEQTLIVDSKRGLDLRREQKASLERWGWVDRDAGVARIPIERAIELVLARPIPAGRPLSEARP
jgi:hypothetical protein